MQNDVPETLAVSSVAVSLTAAQSLKLKLALAGKGISYQKGGELLGCPYWTFGRIVNGQKLPTANQRRILAIITGIPVEELPCCELEAANG